MDPISEKPSFSLRNWLTTPNGKKVLVLFGVSLSVFLVSFLTFNPVKNKPTQNQISRKNNSTEKTLVYPAPSLEFGAYTLQGIFPSVPETVSSYTVKTNLSQEEMKALAQLFGLTEEKKLTEPFVLFYNTTDPEFRGMLYINQQTGAFSFQSYGSHKPKDVSDSSPAVIAKTYVQQLGFDDGTFTEPVTYKEKTFPNITYVEFHRDWQKVELPILSTIGLLNLPEGKPLNTLTLGELEPFTIKNPDIIQTSNNQDGTSRPNDFNTVTVAVSKDGTILSIESNIRKIIGTTRVTRDDLLTPEEALQQFTNHTGDFSLTIPAGTGSIAWDKVYPENIAKAKSAIITDYILTYLENPPSIAQNNIVPMYTIRGIATLDSGYTVRFIQTLPALKDGSSIFAKEATSKSLAKTQSTVLAAKDSLQLQPYYPSGTIIPTPTQVAGGEIEFPAPTPTINPYFAKCPDWTNGTTSKIQVPGLGEMVVAISQSFYNPDKKELDRHGPHTFFFRSATFPVSDIEDVKNKFFFGADDLSKPPGPFEKQLMINVAKRTMGDITASTVDEMYALFKSLNRPFTNSPCDTSSQFERHAPPDLRNCKYNPTTYEGAGLDIPRLQKLGDNVAKRLLQVQQNGTMQSLVSEPDVFPKETIFAFGYIFSSATPNMYYGDTKERFKACYITGTSPVLYLYPEKDKNVSVQIDAPLTYTDPSIMNNEWSVIAHTDGSVNATANYTRPFLYYEYDRTKIQISEPLEGFVVTKDSWKNEVQKIAKSLQLTNAETNSLITEVHNVVTNLSNTVQYVKLSLVEQNEITKKLPLTISPKPDNIYRIHIAVTPFDTFRTVNEQNIQPVVRKGFTVVELGAFDVK